MALPSLTDSGLLPPGVHRATLEEIEAGLVKAAPSTGLRRAVLAGVSAWLELVEHRLGSGTCWLGGGFVSHGEADDLAIAVFLPDDREVAAAALKGALGIELISVRGLLYSYPSPGGSLNERWAVSGLVDTHIADASTRVTYQKALAAVQTPTGGTLLGTVKGIVEVAAA